MPPNVISMARRQGHVSDWLQACAEKSLDQARDIVNEVITPKVLTYSISAW